MPITIFFCYAREDEQLLNKLKAHLRPLQRQGLIDVWHDRDISAGTEWEKEISKHLSTAQIILLLVSPDFMDSDYCYSIEMGQALKRHEKGEAKVIPVILRPVYWYGEPLGKLQALPTDGKPITSSHWHDQDTAFYDITQEIHELVKQLNIPSALALPISTKISQQMTETRSMPPFMQQGRNVAPFIAPLPVEKLRVLHTFKGHTKYVSSVAISPDGQTLVSGSDDHTIKLWNLPTGQVAHTLTNHTEAVFSIAISPDGQTLVSASSDHTIKIWALSSGKELRTLTGHIEAVSSVAISPDGLILVSASWDRTIKVWELSTGEELRTLIDHTKYISNVAISPDGLTLVSASWDRTIKIWKLSTGRELRTLTGHTSYVTSIAISPNGLTLVSGSQDHTLIVWGV
jgi:WD40 repeat protein